MAPKLTTEADVRIGGRVRFFREKARLSQTELANAVGVSFQQIQKNETGKNRISAVRLQAIAERLGVPVAHFYDAPGSAPTPRKVTVAEAMERLEIAARIYAEAVEIASAPLHAREAA